MKTDPLYCTLLGASLLATGSLKAQHDQPVQKDIPNIILVLAEDLGPRFGCFGDEVANTPHIDKLAHEGVRFTHVYTMAGVSSPSRAGLITGVMQNFTGLQHMRTKGFFEHPYMGVPPAHVKGYPEILRKNGYFTYADVKFDYQFCDGPIDPGPFSLWSATGNARNIEDQLLQPVWRNLNTKNKPFFINYNPQITHESGLFTYENTPENMHASVKGKEDIRSRYNFIPTDPKSVILDPYWVDTPETRKEVARFYDNIQIVDMQVGDVIKNLKEDGLWDNTILIVSTDHGDCLPRHKRDGYDSGTRVPMIIRIPEKYRPSWFGKEGTVDDRLISFEDLATTILGFAGIEPPAYMTGIDLSKDFPEKRDYVYAVRGRIDRAPYMRSYFVLGNNYQYIRNLDDTPNGATVAYRDMGETNKALNKAYKEGTLNKNQNKWFENNPKEELYDLEKDPYQLNNIASDAAYSTVLETFRTELDRWRNTGNDMNIVPEAQMVKDLKDENGNTRITLPPVAVQDDINNKIYISNRTQDASIGYSFDGKNWEIYNGSFLPPVSATEVKIKAVRYGWKESDVISISLK
ncbi:MAG TPA: sulfatase [Dysgonomonas sp.]|nr:sulfatase [Dysgonomonas sp.]